MKQQLLCLGLALALFSDMPLNSALGAVIEVNEFGDGGWRSDDTRSPIGGADLVGLTSSHFGKPGQTPSAADDLAIASQIKFVEGPAGSTYGGAVSIDGTANGNGKSSLSVIDIATGFGSSAALLAPTFQVTYEMYKQHTGSGSTLAFKLGIQSSLWGAGTGQSQNGFTATRSGESAWDLILVHVPMVTNNVWTTVNLDSDTGTWYLFDQAGNSFFTPPGSAPGTDKTLADWSLDSIWGSRLFGTGAKVTSIQFGLGSGQPTAIGYVDYLQTNLLNGGDVIDFQSPVPEPGAMAVWTMLAGCASVFGWRRRARCVKAAPGQ